MEGISYKGPFENKLHKFNGWEKNEDLGINVYESFYRIEDYGRFWQQDPKIEEGDKAMSPYASMSNNPISRTDPMGDQDWRQFVASMWRDAGISSSTTPKEFGNTMKEVAKDPNVWIQGAVAGGQIATSTILIGAMTGGTGESTMLEADATAVRSIVRPIEPMPIATEAATVSTGETITLFRGVNENHPGYPAALEGNATPRGGNATPLEHNTINTLSEYTSWSTNKEVATNFALRPNGGGVVLETTVPKSSTTASPNLKSVNLKQSPGTIVSESETLIKGPVSGAKAHTIVPFF